MLFHFFTNLLQSIFFPPGINLLLCFVSYFLWRHHRFLAKVIFVISFVSLWTLSTPIVAFRLITLLQSQYPALDVKHLPAHQACAIVILGGGDRLAPEYGNMLVPNQVTFSRIIFASHLASYVDCPMLYANSLIENYTVPSSSLTINQLLKRFTAISEVNQGLTTFDEGTYLTTFILHHHIKQIYLVTNGWHMPRSMFTFKAMLNDSGVNIIPSPMGILSLEHGVRDFLPNTHGLFTSVIAIREWVGFFVYKFIYRIPSIKSIKSEPE